MAKNTRTARTDAPVEILDARAVGSGGRAGRSEPLTGRVDLRDAADPQALGALAWLLDDVIRIPGTNARIGLDAVIGLVPGIGDSVGEIYQAMGIMRLGAPGTTAAVMMLTQIASGPTLAIRLATVPCGFRASSDTILVSSM